ncbi:anaphase-promoting complex subunit 7 [Topomyia yanbarensis]|uniref:anaphase-promoting complex subunit 7 n=1 Tax=Topomyia yanbarensis TaxID=2498891 RepID=UPI00273B5497|nr:anaphase-promoting complex subunit 7 [Topomyia yanbarensis]XP_058814880.1 anaphase-promoting complex subunit 7 [Topomyia yanbarensis]
MKMGTLFEHLKTLFDYELYSNAKTLSNLILAVYENNRVILTPQQHFCTLVYYAESLFHEHQYREAEGIFKQALQAKRILPKSKSPVHKLSENNLDIFSEVEIKFKTAMCLIEIKRFRDAIATLQSLSIKQRTPKVNMLLSRLCHNHGHERTAIGMYKEVLKDCPLAFEAIEGLLSLGTNGIEVNTLVLNATLASQCNDWLSNWIKAHAHIQSRKYSEAIQTLRAVESNTSLTNYHQLLVLIGECYYHNGEYENAYTYLKRAHSLYPYMKNGIQILAILMAKKKKVSELEKMIAPTSTFPYEYSSEMWFVMAQYLFATAKYDKAVYFVQKACFLNPKNAEALILKAEILLQLKKYQEAIAHLRFAQQFAPYRYEVHKVLVDTYININRLREAQVQALKALKTIGESPRLLVLLGRTYLKDDGTKGKAKTLFQKALELNENYLPAVYLLADLYQYENDVASCMKLLKKHAMLTQNCKLHAMLGDLLSSDKDHSGALEHYTIALNLDPTNGCAMAGLLAMGQSGTSGTGGVNTSYLDSSMAEDGSDVPDNPLEMIEMPQNVHNDVESESDIMWSDVEIEINQ